MRGAPQWLSDGTGLPPGVAWAFATEAELAGVTMARETGEFLALDKSGGLYRLTRQGRIQALTHGLSDARLVAWSDRGNAGVVVRGTDEFCLLDERLNVVWSATTPHPVVGVTMDAWGHNVALSFDNSQCAIINVDRQKLAEFTTHRPLRFLRFAVGTPRLIAAADYGLLCCHQFDGSELWSDRITSPVGDMSITEAGRTVFLAGFAHGIQAFDEFGNSAATYGLEGSAERISVSFFGERLAVTTAEQHLYWFDADGSLLWATRTPEPVCSLVCDPLGEWLVLGLSSGRLLKLDWESESA